jgi:hypothetical protein
MDSITRKALFLLPVILFSQIILGQTDDQKLASTILQKDSLFWITYNTCDTTQFQNFFTDDVEFYHDKGGVTQGLEALAGTIKKNLCSNSDVRLRRQAVAGSLKVFPLKKSDSIYGAILSGEHVFYIIEKGEKERLDGRAKFTHVWLRNDGTWKMSRILSYDHGPALNKPE